MLELLFFLPIIGALLLLLLPERAARGGAFIAALLTLAVSLVLIPSAFGHSGAYGMLSSVTWVEAWGVHWAL